MSDIMSEAYEARVTRVANTVKFVANTLWAWVQHHEGLRAAPNASMSNAARGWYRMNRNGDGPDA